MDWAPPVLGLRLSALGQESRAEEMAAVFQAADKAFPDATWLGENYGNFLLSRWSGSTLELLKFCAPRVQADPELLDLGYYEQEDLAQMNEAELAPELRGLFRRWAVAEKGQSYAAGRSLHAVEVMAAEPSSFNRWLRAVRRLRSGPGQQRFAELLASRRCPLPMDQRLLLMALAGAYAREQGPIPAALAGGKDYPALAGSKGYAQLPVVRHSMAAWIQALHKQGRLSPRTACYVRNFYRMTGLKEGLPALDAALAVDEPEADYSLLD
jgi:hypothetical protein